MTNETDATPERSSAVQEAIVHALQRGARKAKFVPELAAQLRRSAIGDEDLEQAITELDAGGQVLVRDHAYPDPHLAGTDLRVIALVDRAQTADEPIAKAVADGEGVWFDWLRDFLASHRCT